MASVKRPSNEAMPPPDSPERRAFLRQQEALRRKEAAKAARHRAAAKTREEMSSEQKLKDIAAQQEQERKDRVTREAYERIEPEPYRHGGRVKKYAGGGSVSSASKRADGCATKGKTRGRFV